MPHSLRTEQVRSVFYSFTLTAAAHLVLNSSIRSLQNLLRCPVHTTPHAPALTKRRRCNRGSGYENIDWGPSRFDKRPRICSHLLWKELLQHHGAPVQPAGSRSRRSARDILGQVLYTSGWIITGVSLLIEYLATTITTGLEPVCYMKRGYG